MNRQIGDVLYLNWNNQYFGEPAEITKINKKNSETTFDIRLINKQDSWLRAEEGKKVISVL